MNLSFIKKHYWRPFKEINNSIEVFCKTNNFKNILEIGPGSESFSLANKTIGYNEKIKDYIELDVDVDKIPFEDKSIDFVYSRHTLEDIQSPDFCMKEIIRVSNSGYIETPSPLIEMTKQVDAPIESSKYCGYMHHRYIVWSDIQKCEIYFLPKYNSILDNYIKEDYDSIKKKYELINNNPFYWNNYFLWKDSTPKVVMYKNGINFGGGGKFIVDYIQLLNEAVNTSIRNTDYFLESNNINIHLTI